MDARLTPRRLLATLPILAAAVLVGGCGGGGATGAGAPAATNAAPVRYQTSGLSFMHPAAWTAYPFRWAGELHFQPIVYLSTQPVHDPCSTHGNETTCGFPVKRLEPGGVLAVWQVNGIPATSLGPGARIRVDGHLASRRVTADGECRRIGADRTIEVVIGTKPTPAPAIYFTACLRGPGLAREERAVDALIASTKLGSDPTL